MIRIPSELPTFFGLSPTPTARVRKSRSSGGQADGHGMEVVPGKQFGEPARDAPAGRPGAQPREAGELGERHRESRGGDARDREGGEAGRRRGEPDAGREPVLGDDAGAQLRPGKGADAVEVLEHPRIVRGPLVEDQGVAGDRIRELDRGPGCERGEADADAPVRRYAKGLVRLAPVL